MKEMTIKLSDFETVKKFCKMAGECPFDIDIFYNHVVIDAKSILGVMSLDFSRTLHVRMYGEDETFEAFCGKLHGAAEAVA